MKTRNVSQVVKPKWDTIERIYADHGFICIQRKDGTLNTLDVHTAATYGRMMLEGCPEIEPYMTDNIKKRVNAERKRRGELAEKFIEVCRKAKAQLESPKNTEDATIAKVLVESVNEANRPMSPEVKAIVDQGALLYPHLTKPEIRAVAECCQEEGYSKRMMVEILRTENNARQEQWVKTKTVGAPTLLGIKDRAKGIR